MSMCVCPWCNCASFCTDYYYFIGEREIEIERERERKRKRGEVRGEIAEKTDYFSGNPINFFPVYS